MSDNEAEREAAEALLRGWGLTDKPDEYSDGIHGWRCEHPARYGRCDCFEQVTDDLLKFVAARRVQVTDETVERAAQSIDAELFEKDLDNWNLPRRYILDQREKVREMARAALEAALNGEAGE